MRSGRCGSSGCSPGPRTELARSPKSNPFHQLVAPRETSHVLRERDDVLAAFAQPRPGHGGQAPTCGPGQ
eukprot:4128292-Pyramimonas_sp.AAC.1